jgi:hypothetical protein
MATINKLAHRRSFTISKLYSKYNEIKEYHVYNLLEFLYKDKDDWFNPITKKFVNRNSDIIISFLSKGYYVFGDKEIILNGVKLPYKEHIERFIDNRLLIDVRHLKRSPTAPPKRASPNSPPGAGMNLPRSNSPQRSNSPPKIGRTPAPAAPKKASPSSPMGAATNKPKFPPAATPAAAAAAAAAAPATPAAAAAAAFPAQLKMTPAAPSRKPIRFSAKSKGHDKNSERLTEGLCLRFVKDINNKIQSTKTSAELKKLKFANPITGNLIGIESPILRSFLSKCYKSFDKKEIKDIIEELINVSDLIEDDNVATLTPKVDAITLKINEAIDNAINDFYKCCDKLEANCNANGILTAHQLIANVVNSIMTIIHIRYMHLSYLYKKLAIKDKQPLQIYMHDKEFDEYFANTLSPKDIFINYYKNNRIIYQKNNLEISNVITDLNPKNTEAYEINNLFNRQYVFEYNVGIGIFKNTLNYNKNNQTILPDTKYPASLDAAIKTFLFEKKTLPIKPYDYNITNSALPKYVYANDNNEISKYFKDIIDLVNVRLKTLPDVKGFAKEITFKEDYYDNIIGRMMQLSFGNNETGYGKINMIRKNILYSLNAQTAAYMMNHSPNSYKNLFYYSEFSGTFPLFTWIPLKHNEPDTIYNYANAVKWQPLEINPMEVNLIDRYYKNNGIPPWSRWLNETIYKVITNGYVSINSLVFPQRIQDMKVRVENTIGIYKDKTRDPEYYNNKIYLYHGTKTRLHNIANTYDEDIEILGFLSTSLNMYTSSYYAGTADSAIGLIYIIEVDETQTYINLNDQLLQFLLLPNSRIRVIYEFNYGEIRVVICRLIRTPSIETNNKLYRKLLEEQPLDNANKYINYRIKNNNNAVPVCAFMLSKFWRKLPEQGSRNLEVFSIRRDKLNNKEINNITMSKKSLGGRYLYFSLGQEYELYVDRGLPLIAGSFEDIKYSIHQHFIKDCYKAMGIPCLDYIFIHSAFVDNAITTGILLDDYAKNRTYQYKYNVNNFLIDCIFKFNSIPNENKELLILDDVLKGRKYVDKIEGFRDACMYCNGVINPLFNKDASVGEHIQYMRNWKHLFAKYESASDDDLMKHFKWCNSRIDALIVIIKATKAHYLNFVYETLNGKIKDKYLDKKGVIDVASREALELNDMIETLSSTLLKRASYYKKSTSNMATKHFIELIRVVLSDSYHNTHNSKLYKNPALDELILEEKEKNDAVVGGILSIKDMNKQEAPRIKSDSSSKEIDHQNIYEAFKNIPIDSSKDMRKFKDMPKSFQEYYKGAILDKDGCFDISDHCYCRPVKRE